MTINSKNIIAGNDGDAGVLNIYPATSSKGKVEITTSDNSGNTTTTINIATQTAATTITIPNAGAASANIPVTTGTLATNQIPVFSGNAGKMVASSFTISSGFMSGNYGNFLLGLTAGNSVNKGYVFIYSGSTNKGYLNIITDDNTANYNVIINKLSYGQATTLEIPDPSAATARITISPSSTTTNSIPRNSSTVGVLKNSSILIDDSNNISGANDIDAGGVYKVDGIQVLAQQQPPITNPLSGLSELHMTVDSILNALRIHGIIAT